MTYTFDTIHNILDEETIYSLINLDIEADLSYKKYKDFILYIFTCYDAHNEVFSVMCSIGEIDIDITFNSLEEAETYINDHYNECYYMMLNDG